MAFCMKCGTKVDEGVKFCPGCGSPIEIPAAAQTTEQSGGFADRIKQVNNTADSTSDFDANDIQQNKGITVLSYLGPLVFVPLFAKKESKFARFHANQGFTLLIADAAYGVLHAILMAILRAVFPWKWNLNYGLAGGRGFVYDALSVILSLVWVAIGVFAVIGIINAATGKAKELPFIGKIKFFK